MIGTNTFSSTTIAMADYEMEDYVYELNYEGARLAREVCDEVTAKDPTKPVSSVPRLAGDTNWFVSMPSKISECHLQLQLSQVVQLQRLPWLQRTIMAH